MFCCSLKFIRRENDVSTTDQPLPKKPFYRTSAWRICGIVSIVVVCVTEISAFVTRMTLLRHYENTVFYRVSSYTLELSNYPPSLFWHFIGKIFYDGNTDQMFGLIPAMLLSYVIWWIIIGLVLGTMIYFIRRFFIIHC